MNTVIELDEHAHLTAVVAGLLARARHNAQLTRRELAAILGVNYAMIVAHEQG